MKYKAIIFDLDGTLYDKQGLSFFIVLHNLFSLRILKAERVCRRAIRGRYFGSSEALFGELFGRMAEMAGKTPERIRDWYFNKYHPLQVRLLRKYFPARRGIRESILKFRADGVKVAVFSDYCSIEQKLEAIGLSAGMFDLIVEAHETGGLKPCRESFLYVTEKLGTDPSEILMVGDRPATDGAGAESVGMDFRLAGDDCLSDLLPDHKD